MFPEKVQKRLKLLNPMLVEVSNTCLHIKETKNGGEADLALKLQNAGILFKKLEDKKLQYFVNPKCADSVLFEYTEKGWNLHIFECKRSVGRKDWDTIKKQFGGALQNAFALAGVLGIEIQPENVRLYTVYRNDKLNAQANLAKSRMEMHRAYNEENKELVEIKQEWNKKTLFLQIAEDYNYIHTKIKLDVETGEAAYLLE